jgi:hypothetical protein
VDTIEALSYARLSCSGYRLYPAAVAGLSKSDIASIGFSNMFGFGII